MKRVAIVKSQLYVTWHPFHKHKEMTVLLCSSEYSYNVWMVELRHQINFLFHCLDDFCLLCVCVAAQWNLHRGKLQPKVEVSTTYQNTALCIAHYNTLQTPRITNNWYSEWHKSVSFKFKLIHDFCVVQKITADSLCQFQTFSIRLHLNLQFSISISSYYCLGFSLVWVLFAMTLSVSLIKSNESV